MSAFMTCHLIMDLLRHLRPLPSSPAGFRSTFDRLPYGCLLFMYRLDLTCTGKKTPGGAGTHTGCTGKKTPGEGGTHTGHTGHADAQRHTDESHNQPNPPT
jgi:hypothetical protein